MSMYSNRFVISLLVNGQVQKEFANGEVHLPFGTEYAIRFRNKNDRRAVVKLFIDGEKMCRGGFVIPANSYRDIECSSQTLRKFKFVDLQSTEAQDHGKDQSNSEKKMGLIEAHWYLEKATPKVEHHHHHHPYPVPQPYPVWPRPLPYRPYDPWYTCSKSNDRSVECSTSSLDASAAPPPPNDAQVLGSVQPCSMSDSHTTTDFDGMEYCKGAVARPQKRRMVGGQHCNSTASYREIAKGGTVRDGATVEGDYSSQRFGECNVDIEEQATVLKLYLRGYEPKVQEWQEPPFANETGEVPDATILPVDPPIAGEAQYCDRCGAKIAKKSSNFCHICGVRLHK